MVAVDVPDPAAMAHRRESSHHRRDLFFPGEKGLRRAGRTRPAGADPPPPGARAASSPVECRLQHGGGTVFACNPRPPAVARLAGLDRDDCGHGYQRTISPKGRGRHLRRMVVPRIGARIQGAVFHGHLERTVRDCTGDQELRELRPPESRSGLPAFADVRRARHGHHLLPQRAHLLHRVSRAQAGGESAPCTGGWGLAGGRPQRMLADPVLELRCREFPRRHPVPEVQG